MIRQELVLQAARRVSPSAASHPVPLFAAGVVIVYFSVSLPDPHVLLHVWPATDAQLPTQFTGAAYFEIKGTENQNDKKFGENFLFLDCFGPDAWVGPPQWRPMQFLLQTV